MGPNGPKEVHNEAFISIQTLGVEGKRVRWASRIRISLGQRRGVWTKVDLQAGCHPECLLVDSETHGGGRLKCSYVYPNIMVGGVQNGSYLVCISIKALRGHHVQFWSMIWLTVCRKADFLIYSR